MSNLYDEAHRTIQDQRGTRRLADRLEAMARGEFDQRDRGFIESAAMFFLATVDTRGMPTVSYKGGAPGFVQIVSPRELVFPDYDGNGMFLSLGNIASNSNVAMLFIDFQSPRRLRLQGTAEVLGSGDSTRRFPGAQRLVRVTAAQIFANCGRYIHKLVTMSLSPHLPDEGGHQPFPSWKRIDAIADSLPDADRAKVTQAGGPIPIDMYTGEESPDKTTLV
jgi:uncharacterized protein